MASTDEETGFIKALEKPGQEEDLDPEKDPELVQNGGRFKKKVAILQVTWRFPVDFKDPLNIIALIYGYLPFIVPLVLVIDMFIEKRFIAFYGVAMSAVVTLLNEAFLKPIVKDPRPRGSANRKFNEKTKKWEMKPGMPSGHVMNASSTMAWCVLEVALRGPGFDVQPFLTSNILLLILVCTAPVPWARIYNQDHSLSQCTVAGVVGVIFGIVAYFIRAHFFPLSAHKEWCVSSWCLSSGKPWDPFLPDTSSDPIVVAAASLTTMKEAVASAAIALTTVSPGVLTGEGDGEQAVAKEEIEEEELPAKEADADKTSSKLEEAEAGKTRRLRSSRLHVS
ncbi:unnamed protein product [Effrenium voratum]|nr:unnamed protein product [Effrenium voratum]